MEMSWRIRSPHKILYQFHRKVPSFQKWDMPIHFCANVARGVNAFTDNGAVRKAHRNRKNYTVRASLTLEASLAFPLFFFVCFSLLLLMQNYLHFGQIQSQCNEKARLKSIEAFLEEEKENAEGYIQVEKKAECPLPLQWAGIKSIGWTQGSITYPYTGRSMVPEKKEVTTTEQMVYITVTGSVYHKSRECSSLRPSVRKVSRSFVVTARNDSGAIYYPCERCIEGDRALGDVYITDYGNRYHEDATCPGLKRTIREIPLSEVRDRRACKKCG